jgi:beta-lactamase regulating signal transducer with metallopeptidase domain
MDNLIVYLLKVSAGTIILYLFYLVFFSMDSFHNRNRIALLSVLLLPVLIPLFSTFNFLTNTEFTPSSSAIYNIIISENQLDATITEKVRFINVNSLPGWIYISVVIAFISRGVISILSTSKIIRKGLIYKNSFPKIIISDSDHPTFSFFPYVVIPRKVFDSGDYSDILKHETVHVRQAHTFDLLLCELFIAFQWFNPFLWLIRRSMILNHEYQADTSSVKSLTNKKLYQYRLLSIPANIKTIPLAHSFTSSIKKRLVMINKKPTRNFAAMKTLLALPVVAILLIFFSFGPDPGSLNPETQKLTLSEASASKFYEFLFTNMQYPEEAKNSCDTGSIYVVLKIKKGGIVENTKAFSDIKDIKVPMMDEIVVVGYKPSSIENADNNSNLTNDHPQLKAECLRLAGKIGSLDIPEFKEKDMEFALAFKFILK